ncbi:MAG: fibronectin type III domain-containing protein [Paludibacter sp.]
MKTKFLLFALLITVSTSMSWALTAPTAATITGVSTDSQLSVAFIAGADGGSPITTYKYSTDGGATFLTRQTGTTASPIVITTLSTDGTTKIINGTSYNIQIKAVNTIGDGNPSATFAATYVYLGGGAGTVGSPYLIATSNDLIAVKNGVNAAGGAGVAATGVCYKLTADIDMVTAGDWIGIGSSTNVFKGNFDGNYHSISGIHAGSSTTSTRFTYAYVGFFGYIDGATISNLALTNVDFYVSNTAGGSGSSPTIGGLVCATSGTGNILINNCSVAGTIDALAINAATPGGNTWARVGGIVCLPGSTAKVTIINSSVNATLTAKNDVPGIQGFANCAGILGDVASKTGQTVEVINCKAEGSVSAISTNYNSYAGGIFASNDGANTVMNIINCLAKNSVSGTGSNNATVGGIVWKQVNTNSLTQNCMALNSSISATKTTAGAPVYARIGSKSAGTFTNNYASAGLLVQTTIAGVGPTTVSITSTDATTANGADLGTDATGEATSKLNTYISTLVNSLYNGTKLNSWIGGGLATILVNNQMSLKSLIYSVANGVLNITNVEGSKQLSIYSISGAVCKKQMVTDSYSTSLAKGIYIIKVDGFAPTKLVIY